MYDETLFEWENSIALEYKRYYKNVFKSMVFDKGLLYSYLRISVQLNIYHVEPI